MNANLLKGSKVHLKLSEIRTRTELSFDDLVELLFKGTEAYGKSANNFEPPQAPRMQLNMISRQQSRGNRAPTQTEVPVRLVPGGEKGHSQRVGRTRSHEVRSAKKPPLVPRLNEAPELKAADRSARPTEAINQSREASSSSKFGVESKGKRKVEVIDELPLRSKQRLLKLDIADTWLSKVSIPDGRPSVSVCP